MQLPDARRCRTSAGASAYDGRRSAQVSRHAPPVRAVPHRRARARQPHRHRADVPVLGRRRHAERLAPDPPRPPRAVGRGAADPRGDRGVGRGPHHRRRPRPLLRRQRSGARARARRGARAFADRDRACSSRMPAARRRAARRGTAARRCRPTSPAAGRRVAPSAVPHAAGEEPPLALDARRAANDPRRLRGAPRGARARLGLDGIEIHARARLPAAPVPVAARQPARATHYGGSLENRMRFPLEVFDAVRAAFPGRAAGLDAHLGDRLGAGRLGHRRHGRAVARR